MATNPRLARKKWIEKLLVIGMIALSIIFFIVAEKVITLRVRMGEQSRSLLQSLQSDPREFLEYTTLLPPIPKRNGVFDDDTVNYDDDDDDISPNRENMNLTNPNDITKDFLNKYGSWTLKLHEMMSNHCDLYHLQEIMSKRTDTEWCGPGSQNSIGCIAGYFREKSSDKILPCPNGFFCPGNQVCYVICALGGSCNASRPVLRQTIVTRYSEAPTASPTDNESFLSSSSTPDDGDIDVKIGDSNGGNIDASRRLQSPISNAYLTAQPPAPRTSVTVNYFDCEFTHGVARSRPMPASTSQLPGCPGSEHLSLCPAGFFCPSPVEMFNCPRKHYCPLGSAYPLRCSRLLNQCDALNLHTPIERPFFNIVVLLGLALLNLIFYIETRPFKTSASQSSSVSSSSSSRSSSSLSLHSPSIHTLDEDDEARPSTFLANIFKSRNRDNNDEEEEDDDDDEEEGYYQNQSPQKNKMNLKSFQNNTSNKVKYVELKNLSSQPPHHKRSDSGSPHSPNKAFEGENISPLNENLLYKSLPMADPTMDICFEDLGLTLYANNNQILRGVSGEFRSGRLAAIMGPSGTGKTTFLNTLSGRAPYGKTTGYVMINKSVESKLSPTSSSVLPTVHSPSYSRQYDNLRDFTHLVGLVPQSDIMHAWLTVKETLWLYAKLRCRPQNTSTSPTTTPLKSTNDEYINEKVNNLMKVLGLFKTRHSIIGDNERMRGISGGQRKRVNVAMELVLDPSLLLLDEPTTGLDSTTSLELVHALRSIAKHRRVTIAAVIHQPSAKIFKQFHDVLLLGNGGETVYQGPTATALDYFNFLGFKAPAFENPADFFLDVVTAKVPRREDQVVGKNRQEKGSKENVNNQFKNNENINKGVDDDEEEDDDDDDDIDFMRTYFDPSVLSEDWRTFGYRFVEKTKQHQHKITTSAICDLEEEVTKLHWRDRSELAELELPNWFTCFRLFLVRAIIEHMRYPIEFLYEVCLQCLTGFVIGALYSNFTFHDMQQMNFMMSLGVGFTLSLTAMRVFGPNMVVFWREAAPGVGMGLPHSAYFLAKCVVEIPRISLLAVALLTTFYPMASPRSPFYTFFIATFAAGWAVSGWGYILSIAQDPKSAQLSLVVVIVIFAMFCGVAPRLTALTKMGPLALLFSWLSFARWFIECLYVDETIRMSDAWRMPPTFYQSPSQESVLLGLESLSYAEGSFNLNICILLLGGVVTRVFAMISLKATNRHQMGLPPLFRMSSKTRKQKREKMREDTNESKKEESLNEKTSLKHGGDGDDLSVHSTPTARNQKPRTSGGASRVGTPSRSISNALLVHLGMTDSMYE